MTDAIIGSSQADTIRGGAGKDSLWGGLGNDIFKFAPGDLGDERIDGGSLDNESNRISGYGELDFSSTEIAYIDQIAFEQAGSFTFNYGQLASRGISPGSVVLGSAGVDELVFNLPSPIYANVDLGKLKFDGELKWSSTDKIYINGSDGEDVIVGTMMNDTIDGKLGRDALYGEGGDDAFIVKSTYESYYRGGEGVDSVIISGNVSIDKIRLSSIEKVILQRNSSLELRLPYYEPVGSLEFVGSSSKDHVSLFSNRIDASNLNFSNWATEDVIEFHFFSGSWITDTSVVGTKYNDVMHFNGHIFSDVNLSLGQGADVVEIIPDSYGIGTDYGRYVDSLWIDDFVSGEDHIYLDGAGPLTSDIHSISLADGIYLYYEKNYFGEGHDAGAWEVVRHVVVPGNDSFDTYADNTVLLAIISNDVQLSDISMGKISDFVI